MPIDYVITYVDGSDPVWQKEYEDALGEKIDSEKSERFRSWDNLRYNLRAVEKNFPFIRKVHLVVSGPSQVPDWVNEEEVHVVFHKDFIPEKFLPVFCSTSIEMFLGFIPGLAEHFIYANDDMFPGKVCKETDFFVDGKPVLNYNISQANYNFGSVYEVRLNNSLKLAEMVAGKKISGRSCIPPHNMNPMTVSSYKKIWDAAGKDIESVVTKLRDNRNYNQHLYSFYNYLSGNYVRNSKVTTKYLDFKSRSLDSVCSEIGRRDRNLICINDAFVHSFSVAKKKINETFEKLYPNMSKYEKLNDTRDGEKLEVHLYTLCYNELKLVPFAVDYWKTIADKVFVLDNGSTDGSVEYLQNVPGVEVIHFGGGGGFNDDVNMRVKNNVWKASKGKADFVIVTDFDEFMYADDLKAELEGMRERGETICKPRGYNIYSKEFPEYEEGKLCHELCEKAVPSKMFCKCTIFNPNEIKEIRYSPGAHECRPSGNVRWYSGDKIFLLHHKNLGLDYILGRYAMYRKRLSAKNRMMGWGTHYSEGEKKIRTDFENNYKRGKDIKDVIEDKVDKT